MIWVGIDQVGTDWMGIVSIQKKLNVNKFLLVGLKLIGLKTIGLNIIGLEMIGLDMIELEMIAG